MSEMNVWLRRVTESYNMSDKKLVRFGRWFVNADGDLFAPPFSFQGGAYPIYSDGLTRGKASYSEALSEWLAVLTDKSWIQEKDSRAFTLAFTKAWHRSAFTDKEDTEFQKTLKVIEDKGINGIGCTTDMLTPELEVEDPATTSNFGENQHLLLEFSAEQRCFHYNYIKNGVPRHGYSESYRVIAETTDRVAGPFTAMMHARMINGAVFTFDQVVAEWNYYVFLLLQFNDSVQSYGKFRKPSSEDMRRIEERINFYDGDYEGNEMMKLRTIGLPKARE